ncbi:agmatinase, mitochondrial-like [Saccoglossus kowalevskii]|uniref:Agmatinase, mitochondrial-like n=1 Tax=Saccoglossus kowalevskii TaxID=10224 RepID=A0ABM0GJW6_SACKO|nr:PREDICTED: agmatinase, mitochondrial-like [Saccoglossus kowalevskii]
MACLRQILRSGLQVVPSRQIKPRTVKAFERSFTMTNSDFKKFNEPLSGLQMARAGGIASMFRLPVQQNGEGLDVCFLGIPLDIGVSNRTGTRFGPRQIRTESCLIRAFNNIGAAPYESLQVADIGDVNINLYDLKKACVDITEYYRANVLPYNCIPLTLGGDHTLSYPVMKAVAEKHGPLGLVHIDAHADTTDLMLGEPIAHGTPFKRCFDDNILDCKRVVQIGLRGSQYEGDPNKWQKDQGFRVVLAEDCWHKSLVPLMAEVRQQMGSGPVYISFDIDAIDPGFAPGTGTPEIGGLTTIQALEAIRGCRGMNIVGGDLVEVPLWILPRQLPVRKNVVLCRPGRQAADGAGCLHCRCLLVGEWEKAHQEVTFAFKGCFFTRSSPH